ncbi:plasmid partitioning protein RepB [Brucellaceae bacterium C25G]
MSRKDSKGMFAAVLGKLDEETTNEQASARSASPHLMKVAAGVRHMQERSEMAERLLKNADQIVELEPDLVLPSLIDDRFDSAYDDVAIAEIIASMQERGQIVPGLVRPLDNNPGKFQIVYGRRRLAAAKQLGIKFKAAIRALSDEEAVIFQGEENTAREDLSFIEKCLFAVAQEDAGFKRETICASLSTGKSHISEMIRIGQSLPKSVLYAIGKAPNIGRGRWEEFTRLWPQNAADQMIESLLSSPDFISLGSDERFLKLLSKLHTKQKTNTTPTQSAKTHSNNSRWAAIDKTINVSVKKSPKKTTLSIEAADSTKFADFITNQLDELYAAFKQQ